MPRWWHDEAGKRWLDELPDLVQEQCRRWNLTVDGAPWHGSNALVLGVRDHAGTPMSLRVVPPTDDIVAESSALHFWAGRGTVALHAVDVDRGTMLLERLDGDTTLMSLPLRDAVSVLAELVNVMAVPAPAAVASTAQAAAELAERLAADWEELGRPAPWGQLQPAQRAAEERATATHADTAVNGDLHFEQVLRGSRAPWLVVDPVLLRGDVEYDLGRILWSRLDEVGDDAEVRGLFDLFVETASVPSDRARAWVLIRAASYLMWGLRNGLTRDPPKCLRLLTIFA